MAFYEPDTWTYRDGEGCGITGSGYALMTSAEAAAEGLFEH
jgi:hypothetical protein